MKRILKQYVLKFLQRKGIYLVNYPSPKRFLKEIGNKNPIAYKESLKTMSNHLSNTQDHKYYDLLLSQFIPNWSINYSNVCFIGSDGGGNESLNSYRKIVVNKELLFEKVYFNDERGVKVTEWVNEYIAPIITIDIPKIKKVIKGDFLSAFYFEFKILIRIKNESQLLQFLDELLRLNNDFFKKNTFLDLPDFMFNYKPQRYLKHLKILRSFENELGIDLNALIEKVENSTLVFSHTDIKPQNSFNNNILIDWDQFSMQPIGYDMAYVYYHIIQMQDIKEAYHNKWLEQNFRKKIKKELWDELEFNFLFFLIVFSFKSKKWDILGTQLLKELQRNY